MPPGRERGRRPPSRSTTSTSTAPRTGSSAGARRGAGGRAVGGCLATTCRRSQPARTRRCRWRPGWSSSASRRPGCARSGQQGRMAPADARSTRCRPSETRPGAPGACLRRRASGGDGGVRPRGRRREGSRAVDDGGLPDRRRSRDYPSRRGRSAAVPRGDDLSPAVTTDFSRVAIVNRGEPAMRLLNAVARVQPRARHTTSAPSPSTPSPIADSWFVREADEAFDLGSATFVDPERRSPEESLPRLRATRAGAAIDSGRGGLGRLGVRGRARRVRRAVRAARHRLHRSVASEVMRRLGDKIASKQLAEEAGVPVVALERWAGRDARRGTGAREATRLSRS